MAIEWISGDLFVNRVKAEAFAHGCNCKGSMGAGIAVGFLERYPDMYEEYRRRCKSEPSEFQLGDCFYWPSTDQPSVFNLGTQTNLGGKASLSGIESALTRMKEQADTKKIKTIAIPRIGAGYGHLSWEKVKAIVIKIFEDWKGTLYVYEEYKAESLEGER